MIHFISTRSYGLNAQNTRQSSPACVMQEVGLNDHNVPFWPGNLGFFERAGGFPTLEV